MINKINSIDIAGGKLYFGPALSKENLEKITNLYCVWNLLDFPGFFLEFDKSVSKEVIHTPIEDYSIPKNVEKFSEDLNYIISLLQSGKVVYLHCFAGHGRTGMALACLLGKINNISSDESLIMSKSLCNGPESECQVNFVKSFLKT